MTLHAVARSIGPRELRTIINDLPGNNSRPSCTGRTLEEEWSYLLGEFNLGFSEGVGFLDAGDPSILHEHLGTIYQERLQWLYETGGETLTEQVLQCEQLAKQLGTLTGRLFAAEVTRPDLYFGIPDHAPTLAKKHLETARDMLGFYLNSRLANRHRPRVTLQVEDPCPLCR